MSKTETTSTKKIEKTPKKEKPAPVKIKNVKKIKKVNGRPFFLKFVIGAARILFLLTSLSLLLVTGGVYAYSTNYGDKALFGTKILGQEVGGKNQAEVQAVIEEKISEITFSFKVDDQDFEVKPAEAGVTFNTTDVAKDAVSFGKTGSFLEPWLRDFTSLVYRASPQAGELIDPALKNNVAIKYNIDDQKLSTFTQNLSAKFGVESKNAGLVVSGSEVQVIPAVYGKKLLTDSVKVQIAEALKSAKSDNIKIEVEKVNPKILEADTQQSIDAARNLLNLSIRFHYQGKNFNPDKATVGSWVIFNTVDENGKQKLVPVIDAKKAYPYIYNLGSNINVPAINKKVTLKNGAEQVVEQEGKDGLALDVDLASYNTAQALNAGKGVDMELPTYAVKYKTTVNNIVVADWAKYIDVNISSQTMCAYLAGGNLVGCWPITTGRNGWNTPTGTFLIERRVYVTSMPNPPSPYPLTNIHYVSYFTAAGHAIHEAWWRSSFGGQDYVWNGSHGCVNASLGVAQTIYDWAPIGTPVIIHY